jgi:uncharacterized membrane protein
MRVAKIKLYILVGTLIAIWCGNFIALKVCLRAMSPLGVTSFRTTAAAIILYGIHRLKKDKQGIHGLKMGDFIFFFKLAFLGLVLNQLLFITGLHFTTVAHSAVIVTVAPLFTMLFAWMQGQEKLTPIRILGMSLSIVGVVCLNLDHDLRFHTEYLVGDSHLSVVPYVCVLHRSKQGRFCSIRSYPIHGVYVFCRRLSSFPPRLAVVSLLFQLRPHLECHGVISLCCSHGFRVGALNILLCSPSYVRFAFCIFDLSSACRDDSLVHLYPLRKADTQLCNRRMPCTEWGLVNPTIHPSNRKHKIVKRVVGKGF